MRHPDVPVMDEWPEVISIRKGVDYICVGAVLSPFEQIMSLKMNEDESMINFDFLL